MGRRARASGHGNLGACRGRLVGGADWWDAGRLIQQFGDARHWNTSKRRDFQNDALIALTAKRHGATVVTADRADFELLGSALHIQVRFV